MELFLDTNAHLPLSRKAGNALVDFCTRNGAQFGHPSAISRPGRDAMGALEGAREDILETLNGSGLLIFTDSCTQACEWAAKIISRFGSVGLSDSEHPSMASSIRSYAPSVCDLQTKGGAIVPPEPPCHPSGIACIRVHNETGIINDLSGFGSDPVLLSDVSQAVGKIPVDLDGLGVDMAVFGGHKFGGPHMGALYLADEDLWEEFGTGSRYGLDRPGTPDVGGAVVLAAALKEAVGSLECRSEKMREFQFILERGLAEDGLEVLCGDADRAPSTTFFYLPDAAGALLELSQRGMHVGLGAACGSLHKDASPYMESLGFEGTPASDFMRISQFGDYGEVEANHFLNIFREVRKQLEDEETDQGCV